jgi:hypothetical protein
MGNAYNTTANKQNTKLIGVVPAEKGIVKKIIELNL